MTTVEAGDAMSAIGSADTKPILQALLDLGFPEELYSHQLHHAGHRPAAMLKYEVGHYRANDKNVLLHRKLAWILRTYRDDWTLGAGRYLLIAPA